eukprot:CCRYP_010983-RA/>CCRYP_010983-RA protein AED:0.51 eAED:0.45 QI:0/-1/0/1/-1/1/1/0/258
MKTVALEQKEGITMVQTVRGNYEGYTCKEIMKAREARDAQAMMAHPSDETMRHPVSSTNAVRILNSSVPAIANTRNLFGPDLRGVTSKTVLQRPDAVKPEFVLVPWDLYNQIKNVTLTTDVMFVNGIPFLVTLSWDIRLGSVEFLPSRTVKNLTIALEKVLLIYRWGGYTMWTCLMDMEFEKLKEAVGTTVINTTVARDTTAAQEHAGNIEQYICTIKERALSVASQLPYKKHLQDQVVIQLMKLSMPSHIQMGYQPS